MGPVAARSGILSQLRLPPNLFFVDGQSFHRQVNSRCHLRRWMKLVSVGDFSIQGSAFQPTYARGIGNPLGATRFLN
jgi:hypothetical protein